jgi:hypothetical protein
MALGIPEAIAEVARLLSKAFGFVVDPTGLATLKRENLLKLMMRGADEAIFKNDWATCDALLRKYEQLHGETGP